MHNGDVGSPRPLGQYREKRDFARTPEPAGAPGLEPGEAPRFVVQEHHASALHWDFRLERDGVLVSWAVPKGIPADPKKNHRAIHVEDHPIEYGSFEGTIPAGEYGAGEVTVWDHGIYECEKFRDDEVMVILHGSRLKGRYVLFRTDGKNWMIHRMDPPQDGGRETMPRRLSPMLAKLSGLPRNESEHAFEIKWDGVRAIAYIEGGRCRLESRNLLDLTKQFPEVTRLGGALGSVEAVLDGEIVALDTQGRPSFERLQNRLGLTNEAQVRRRSKDTPATYQVFDLLFLNGHATTALAYRERRQLLEALDLAGPSWSTPAYHLGDGRMLLEAVRAQGLEGLVAKRLDSPYLPGKRTPAWLKIKATRSQEFVVGGWTPGEGARSGTIGALLLGTYDRARDTPGEPQRLIYAGKVGTGFTEAFLQKLMSQLRTLPRERPTFDDGDIPPGARFVEPRLVAAVAFTEWTSSGSIRHPSFKGLRLDKDPRDVVREEEMPV